MRRMVLCSFLVLFCLSFGSTLWAHEGDKPALRSKCKYCGMSPDHFTWSRVILEYEDGTKVATCSLRCACVELASNMGVGLTRILVGDYQTKELIDAETAVWVVGGDKHGVMAKTGKWAFAKKEDAEKFKLEHGGIVGGFGDALDTAYKDISDSIKTRRERAKMMKAKAPEKQG